MIKIVEEASKMAIFDVFEPFKSSTMLAELLYNHFNMINSRLNTFTGIIKSLILCRGSNYKNLAEEQKSNILLDSKIKAISRFFSSNSIMEEEFYGFMSLYIPKGKVQLSIDRTTWEMGKEIRNILVLAVSYDKIAMPLMYKIINYKGACTADDQIELIENFIKYYGSERIAFITGDREFDNERFITYLDSKEINYALRVRKTNRILNADGKKIRIDSLIEQPLSSFETKFYTVAVKFDHLKLSSGEYLSVVSSRDINNGLELYKRRWDIESSFKGCKTSGFRMESTHIKNQIRFENFIKCIFIAFAITIKTGEFANSKNAIKVKKTLGCKAHSVLQYGIMAIRNAYAICNRKLHNLIKQVLLYGEILGLSK